MLSVKPDHMPEKDKSSAHWIGPAPAIESALPGPTAGEFVRRDQTVSSPSNTRDYPLVVKRASGSVIEDTDGNRFLDFAAGIAVCSTGHCHPKVVEAIERQARSLIHICGSDFYYPVMVELMEKLAAITPGSHKKRVLLTNSGAEAVEATIKLTRHNTRRKYIIAFHGAFHGRTMGALSLTCSKARQKEFFGPLVPMTDHVAYGDVDAIENVLFKYKMNPEEVAAIFVEALQGEGGYHVAPPGFLARLRELCDKHGILLVCDEIQSGAGRTGKWFAFQHFDVVPDVVLMAKGMASGMPIGAVITSDKIMAWPPGAQGSTFGGNPVCCAAAVATLELIEKEFMANAVQRGPQLMNGLKAIAEKRKSIANVRGLGLMIGVDVVNTRTGKFDPKLRAKILQGAFNRGLVLLGCGETAIRFAPPLCINDAQIDVGLRILDETLAAEG
ncbi:MAG: aminotransferase class III-fold pyridoxal phosphate-dependent enzyme [Phycisphaerae bacterium]|nr:aminotransferase class III-fold pyridoxal phosphate-dependent enzyme [Phycisphaerae bacterium]